MCKTRPSYILLIYETLSRNQVMPMGVGFEVKGLICVSALMGITHNNKDII